MYRFRLFCYAFLR